MQKFPLMIREFFEGVPLVCRVEKVIRANIDGEERCGFSIVQQIEIARAAQDAGASVEAVDRCTSIRPLDEYLLAEAKRRGREPIDD